MHIYTYIHTQICHFSIFGPKAAKGRKELTSSQPCRWAGPVFSRVEVAKV